MGRRRIGQEVLGYVLLDKSDDSTSGLLPTALSGGLTGGLSGTFSFSAPGFTDIVIAFKSGFAQIGPTWAAFLLPAGVTSGSWAISGRQALSHVNLYGIPDVTRIALPAGLWLMLGAVGCLGTARRRRAPA